MPYLPVLDVIRFFAAFAVVFHHSRPPDLGLDGAYSVAFFGPAAVLVFFLVSGFCIHAPYVASAAVGWPAYFVRRYIRLLVPLAFIVPVATATGASYHPYRGLITWSLVCELVYYTAYPLLRAGWKRFGWAPLFVLLVPLGYATVLLWSVTPGSIAATAARDILSNLPVWLAGCLLADLVLARKITATVRPWSLVLMRLAVYGAAMAVAALHYRHVVAAAWTLPAFGLLAAGWLWAEVSTPRNAGVLSWCGGWSYSLYLAHVPALWGVWTYPCDFVLVTAIRNATMESVNARFPIGIAFALLFAYTFFLVVEKPSHRLARWLSSRLGRPRRVAGGEVRAPHLVVPPTR